MSVSNDFTAAEIGRSQIVPPMETVTYEVTGTFTGVLFLEREVKGGTVAVAETVADTALAEATYENNTLEPQYLHWRGEILTGTATGLVTSVAGEKLEELSDVVNPRTGRFMVRFRDDGVEIPNLVGSSGRTDGVGGKNGATVSVAESGQGTIHKTVLTLTVTPIALTDDADVGQWGTLELYNFPAGNILVLGAVIDAILTLDDTEWTDAAEGDLALGSAPSTDASALATTLADILASTAIAAMTAQVGPIDAQSLVTGAPLASAGGVDDNLNLNVLIDDAVAHITGTGSITGTVEITWLNLGDIV